MELTRKRAAFLEKAIQRWKENDIVSQEDTDKLLGSLEVVPFDWRRLAKYSFGSLLFAVPFRLKPFSRTSFFGC